MRRLVDLVLSVVRRDIFVLGALFTLFGISTPGFGQSKREYTAEEHAILAASRALTKQALTFTPKALQIGDRVPDIVMKTIINYPGGSARLSDFKGKHILLDFWSRGCKSCIASFPKIEKLQEKYQDKIKILEVCTYNSLESLNVIEPGFPQKSTSRNIRDTQLPLVFNSQDMVDFFPHKGEPYLVWIDTGRIVRAMIDSWNIGDSAIQNFLAGKYNTYPLAISFKRIFDPIKYAPYDASQSFLEEGDGRFRNNIVYLKRTEIEGKATYVALAKLGQLAARGGGGAIKDSISGLVIGERVMLMDLVGLFQNVYRKESRMPGIDRQRVFIESANPARFYRTRGDDYDKWVQNYTYSYEVVATSEKQRRALLKEALEDYFNIDAVLVKRKIKCFLIQRTSVEDKLKTDHPTDKQVCEVSGLRFFLRNAPYGYFVSNLKVINETIHDHKTIPIFDESGFPAEHKIDLELENINIEDVKGLNSQLSRYGLILRETEREKEVLILKERKSLSKDGSYVSRD